MDIDLDQVLSQKRELQNYSEDLSLIKKRLLIHKEVVNSAWKGKESEIICESTERIANRISALSGELEQIGIDLLEVYQMEQEISE